MGKAYDVIIAVGGPVGLFLACELGLRGTSVLILESNPKSESPWKIEPLGRRGLNTPSVKAFYRRGLLDKLFDCEDQPSTIRKTSVFHFGGHFVGIMLNANKLELDRWKYRLPGPFLTLGPTTIKKIEAVLIERAESLGVAILRDKAVNEIVAQSGIGITVKTSSDDASCNSRWLDVMNRVTGITDLEITTVHLVSSYTDRSKQATSYRKGRILLAGDAAHIHSSLGAQGLNVGLGDAMNLGWKQATTIRQEAISNKNPVDLTLLDIYENERHPVGAWVLGWTRAQVAMLQPDLYGAAIQTLRRDLIDTPVGTNLFLDRIWGLSQR
ncbi:hypothetical protein BTUL_0014g00930 [Botrytis tulipae]|uniref:FAD-binding domain-containing protein n=1 Tax=Botrytis tulipae TaxID=87230 RepID=A0A4Z1F9A4_9HELO|nr:hypothetical protein BTUL_0014g00930 [Botrytis tulipae]